MMVLLRRLERNEVQLSIGGCMIKKYISFISGELEFFLRSVMGAY